MTFQEILDTIVRHRQRRVKSPLLQTKIDEIEWALQTIAEKLRDQEDSRSST